MEIQLDRCYRVTISMGYTEMQDIIEGLNIAMKASELPGGLVISRSQETALETLRKEMECQYSTMGT